MLILTSVHLGIFYVVFAWISKLIKWHLFHVSRQSINKLFSCFRYRIATICEEETTYFQGEFEIGESYFGARRVRGIRGRGAKGKTIVFGILKRGGKVSVYLVENCKQDTLLPIIKRVIKPDSIIYTDGFRAYENLLDEGFKALFIVNHGNNEFAKNGTIHTNGIENFWGLFKSRLIMSIILD